MPVLYDILSTTSRNWTKTVIPNSFSMLWMPIMGGSFWIMLTISSINIVGGYFEGSNAVVGIEPGTTLKVTMVWRMRLLVQWIKNDRFHFRFLVPFVGDFFCLFLQFHKNGVSYLVFTSPNIYETFSLHRERVSRHLSIGSLVCRSNPVSAIINNK